MNLTTKRLIWVAVIIIVYFLIVAILPAPDLSASEKDGALAVKAIALMVCAVLAWISQCIPIAISSLCLVFLQHLTGVFGKGGQGPAIKEFVNPTLFFVIASFILAIALTDSGLGKRISLKLTAISKGKPKTLVFLIYFACATVSTVISDIPAAATFVPVALAVLEKNQLKPGSNLGKSLMIGIGLAALIGGVATPAGSSMNMLTIDNLVKVSEGATTITFLQWSTIGIPVVIVSFFVIPFVLNFIFPPEMEKLAGMEEIDKDYKALGKFSAKETKFVIIMACLLIAWFTESVHKFPTQLTAVIGATIMFLPGIDLVTWDSAKGRIGWDLFMLMGAANSLGGALSLTGAAAWISATVLGGIVGQPALIIVLIVIVFTAVIHLIVPVNPALVTILVPTLYAFASQNNINPALLIVPMGFSVSAAFLLPLDPVPLLPYATGYFTFGNFFKAGWITTLVWTVILTIAVFLLAPVAGLY